MLRQKITDALKDAMRAKDDRAVGTIRMMIAKMKEKDIEARPSGNADGIGDPEIMSMLQGMIKQRRESIALYEQGNRQDLAKQEGEEITVIERFLPQQMDAQAVQAAITAAISATGASGVKDMGKVMAELKQKYSGQMDFSTASATVKQALTG